MRVEKLPRRAAQLPRPSTESPLQNIGKHCHSVWFAPVRSVLLSMLSDSSQDKVMVESDVDGHPPVCVPLLPPESTAGTWCHSLTRQHSRVSSRMVQALRRGSGGLPAMPRLRVPVTIPQLHPE